MVLYSLMGDMRLWLNRPELVTKGLVYPEVFETYFSDHGEAIQVPVQKNDLIKLVFRRMILLAVKSVG